MMPRKPARKYWRGIQAREQPSVSEQTEPVVARSAMAKPRHLF
jgi:hypothetical protein